VTLAPILPSHQLLGFTVMSAKVARLTPRGWAASRQILAAVRDTEVDWNRRIGAPRMDQPRAILWDLMARDGRSAAGNAPSLRHAVTDMWSFVTDFAAFQAVRRPCSTTLRA
jgi:hypothetical protein